MTELSSEHKYFGFKTITSVRIQIQAPMQKVMFILTDVDHFTDWNSTILSLKGSIKQGDKVHLVSALEPGKTFTITIKKCTHNEMVWKDSLGPLFAGIRTFRLTPMAGGGTEFFMEEIYKGVLLPVIRKIVPDFKKNFEQYAKDLKTEAERV